MSRLSATPTVLNPADEVTILVGTRLSRLWLRVAFAVASDAEPARAALAAARFISRTCAIDKRLRMTVDSGKSTASADELVLVFVLGRWGSLEAKWLEEAKPAVLEAAAGFEGTELRALEVISE
jgi:hypothetical protein